MKHLYLIRHAKSSWSDPRLADFDRPLNKRGKRDAPFMGQRLAATSTNFDLIVSSGAKRARKTARLLAREINYPKEAIVYQNDIYTSNLFTLLSVIKKTGNQINALALVGHNHVITECAEWLSGEHLVNIPTSGIAAIRFEIDAWEKVDREAGTLVFFDYPKLHAAPGGGG